MMKSINFLFLLFLASGICSEILTCAASAAYGDEPAASPSATSGAKSDSSSSSDSAGGIRVYEVRKKVADFPDMEDLSTPESAYATIERAYIMEGGSGPFWQRLSVPELAVRMTPGAKKPLPKDVAEISLNCEIIEVHVWDETHAVVIARTKVYGREGYVMDLRWLELVKGRWLNTGNDHADSIENARKKVASGYLYETAKRLRDERPPVADPAAHLQPFVDFLRREAKDPRQFLLDAIGKHRVVILGEIHHLSRSWAFDAALVRSPEFARQAGVIYMELPSNDQPLVDRFFAASKYDPEPVIEMLRDMMEVGSPDQPILDFFRTVWEVNQELPEPQRLRIMIVDMARPWKEIKRREDWRKYDVDRNQLMAENIVRDLEKHAADKRHALFIVGFGHAMVNLTRPDGEPMKSAGWHLREKLGEENVFAVIPHGPVETNLGQVTGRRALGLFETAFAAVGNKPMAFPLDRGPFGTQVFDADPDILTSDPYGKGFHAYLYFGPLEDEVFSPVIPGYFSDEFVREVDRRWRITYGKGLVEAGLVKQLDGASVVASEGFHYGQPIPNWSAAHLGPLNAWHYGSHWEDVLRKQKQEKAMQFADEVETAAKRLFQAIRTADYNRDWQTAGQWQHFLPEDIDYTVNHDLPAWVNWICAKFKTNPIVEVQLGKVFLDGKGRPTVHYEMNLKDGEILRGDLPFQWNPKAERWEGWEGLDWHITNASWLERFKQGIDGYLQRN
jgi:hypothetical protein